MAAQQATMIYQGRSGKRYSINAYLDDTATNPVRFDETKKAVAASPDRYRVKEDGAIVDFIIAAASGQTHTQILRSGTPTGDILLNAVQLAAITFRPQICIPFAAGNEIMMTQLA